MSPRQLKHTLPHKMTFLDAARGIAAVIVMLRHITNAFFINQTFGLLFTPLYIFINGAGAVIFFFVISGFVLTYRYFQDPSTQYIVQAAIKRLPRLMLPASITIICGYIILKYNLSAHVEAGTLAQSDWLKNFANAGLPAHISFVDTIQVSFIDALQQTLWVFLVPYTCYYNSSLWTMHPEFIGSLGIFGNALLCSRVFKKPAFVHVWFGSIILALACFYPIYHQAFTAFMVGSWLAYIYAHHSFVIMPYKILRTVMFLVAIFSFSTDFYTLEVLGASLLLILLLSHQKSQHLLSGRVGYWLGQFSFPLYLVHTLVILTVISHLYVYMHHREYNQFMVALLTVISTVVISLVAAIPFVWLEKIYLPWLNKAVRAVTR